MAQVAEVLSFLRQWPCYTTQPKLNSTMAANDMAMPGENGPTRPEIEQFDHFRRPPYGAPKVWHN